MTVFNYQLYSSREFSPISDTLKMLGEAGYAGVEGHGPLFADLDDAGLANLKRDLDANGLTMPTAHLGLDALEGDLDHVRRIAAALGIETIYCPFLEPDQRPDDAAGWQMFSKRLEAIGAAVRETGLGFGWHNHDFEFVALADGTRPIEHLFANGTRLEWEADIAWIARSGADPFAWIERLSERITSVHVKDIAPTGENIDEDGWADVGHGTLPWRDLLAPIARTPVRHYIMEHDKPADDRRFAVRSLEAARRLAG